MSNPETIAEFNKQPNPNVILRGRLGEAMSVQNTTMYIFADTFKTNLL